MSWSLHCHLPVFAPPSLQERLDSLNNPEGGRFTGQGEAGPPQQEPRQGAGQEPRQGAGQEPGQGGSQEPGQGGSQEPGQRLGQPQRGGEWYL